MSVSRPLRVHPRRADRRPGLGPPRRRARPSPAAPRPPRTPERSSSEWPCRTMSGSRPWSLAGELGRIGYDEITPAASAALGVPAERRTDLLSVQPGAVTYLAVRGAGLRLRNRRSGPVGARCRSGVELAPGHRGHRLAAGVRGERSRDRRRRCLDPSRRDLGGRCGVAPPARRPSRYGWESRRRSRPRRWTEITAGVAGAARRGHAGSVLRVRRQVVARPALGEHRGGDHAARRPAGRQYCRCARPDVPLPRRHGRADASTRHRFGRSKSRWSGSRTSRSMVATSSGPWWTASR